MSAFIVSDTHINALVRYASRHKLSVYFNRQLGFPFGKERLNAFDNEQAIAQILLDENVKSVNYRYRDNEVMSITYDRGAPVLTAIEAIKAAQCLRYQSCEYDDFKKGLTQGGEDSIASKLIEAIIAHAIPRLEGYDSAQWAIADKEVTA